VGVYTRTWTDVVPDVYYDACADGDGEQGSMHAKCVVVDDSLIVTSHLSCADVGRDNAMARTSL
jgi:hypothetical protein